MKDLLIVAALYCMSEPIADGVMFLLSVAGL